MDLSTVYHKGTLRPPRKKRLSYEGAGVSVSVDPHAWQQIAQLGGPVWRLRKPHPKFLLWSRALDKRALTWAAKNGWLIEALRYQTSYYDEEIGDTVVSEYDSLNEAKEEAEGNRVKTVHSYKLGPKGLSYWKRTFSSRPNNSIARGLVITWYAEALGYEGVWWEERFDPSRLSAPRGVIFNLSGWRKTKLRDGEYCDLHQDY